MSHRSPKRKRGSHHTLGLWQKHSNRFLKFLKWKDSHVSCYLSSSRWLRAVFARLTSWMTGSWSCWFRYWTLYACISLKISLMCWKYVEFQNDLCKQALILFLLALGLLLFQVKLHSSVSFGHFPVICLCNITCALVFHFLRYPLRL